MKQGREVRLVSRPHGLPTSGNFEVVDVDVPEPGAGQVLVRNTYMSVDPYMRGRMSDAPSYVAPFEIGKVLDGGAVGVVEVSRDARFPVGSTVMHSQGWRTHAVGLAQAFRGIDAVGVSPSAYLGVLGMPAFTAYVGLFVIDNVKARELQADGSYTRAPATPPLLRSQTALLDAARRASEQGKIPQVIRQSSAPAV